MASVGGGFSCPLNGSLLSAHNTVGTSISAVDARLQSLAPVVYGRKMQRQRDNLHRQPSIYPDASISEQQQWVYSAISAGKL